MGHASSSRERILDDEYENMSPTQCKTNGEPRRDNFMVHEEGTGSNSEFTHPKMPLSQTMLNKYDMRKQRNKAHKSHKQQIWLKVELHDNVHRMRSAVHAHFLLLLKLKDKDFASLLAPPSTEEFEVSIKVYVHLGYVPEDPFNEPSTRVQYQDLHSYFKNELHKLGLGDLVAT
ncbi:hypothetical protein O181_027903 [Austropuccinia psidii MF-1]|uniref:Uncharacterized protein n=1 Tax=Austropuccinia psidii MF-1 TaxID=1389203 RepID=A0A9Q3CSP0_9BASI|nr:hypothetical protein [Austropuccinia psidii MF-1]